MKKNLLSLFFAVMTVLGLSQTAQALNSYAYGLKSELGTNGKTLTVNYSLNANAEMVTFTITNGDTSDSFTLEGITAGDHSFTYDVSTLFAPEDQLLWEISVQSPVVETPTESEKSYRFYHPAGVAVDNNIESPFYGRVYVTEAMNTTSETYVSCKTGQGVYVFDPCLNPVLNATGEQGFTGGMAITQQFPGTTTNSYDPRRIRISKDGRVFVSRQTVGVSPIFEIDPANLDGDFKPVFNFASVAENWDLLDAEGNFIGAPNAGFDVKGSGNDLKILTLSANASGVAYSYSGFRCDEYNLGTATTWEAAPSKNIEALSGKYSINYMGINVVYDNEGGIWYCQYRGTPKDTEPALVHVNAEGVEDYKNITMVSRQAGIAFSPDFSKVAIANAAKQVGIYEVTKADGVVDLKLLYEFATNIGNNLNDIAWDLANNLYLVGNSSEYLKVFALPRDSKTVTTPAAEKYIVSVPEVTKMYVLGHTAANNYTWAANVGQQLTLGEDGLYHGEVTFAQSADAAETEYSYFGLATVLGADENDWEGLAVNRYGAEYGDQPITNKEATKFIKSDYSFKVQNGTYDVTVDLNNMTVTVVNHKEVVVTYPEELYMIGTFNGWTFDNYATLKPVEGKEGVYEGTATFTAEENWFGISGAIAADWDTFNNKRFGPASDGDEVTLDAPALLISSTAAYKIKGSDKPYSFTVDIPAQTLLVSLSSGVEGAEVPVATVVAGNGRISVMGEVENVAIYTLGGVLVSTQKEAQVASGAYIVVADGVATKVLVK
ncbi:MAG: hypothetical protein ACI30C_03140 [Muribaculaceae bacterium]